MLDRAWEFALILTPMHIIIQLMILHLRLVHDIHDDGENSLTIQLAAYITVRM